MDHLDIVQVYDIPDTPDKLATQDINGRGCMEKESGSLVPSNSGSTDFSDEGAKNRITGSGKLGINNKHSRRLFFRPGTNLSISNNSECESDMPMSLVNSSSRNPHLFRRPAADKTSDHENKYSRHSQYTEKGKAVSTSQSSTWGKNAVVDLMEQNRPSQVLQKAFPNRVLEGRHAKEIRKGSILTSGLSSLHGIANSSTTTHNAYKVKEKIDDKCKGGSGIDRGKGIFGDSNPKAGKNVSVSCSSISSPRVSGQKRLVRNGCISPQNIEKAKCLAENHSYGSTGLQTVKETLAYCSSSQVRDLIAEDNNFHRRKEMMSLSSKEPDTKSIDLSTRRSMTHNEEACGTSNANGGASDCFEVLGGWRTTNNRTKKINLPLTDKSSHLSQTKEDPCFVNQQNENTVVRRENGNGWSNGIDNDHHDNGNVVSFKHGSAPTVFHSSKSNQVNGHPTAARTPIKRHKRGYASSNRGESSTPVSIDSEIVFIGSSGEPSNSKSTRNQNSHGLEIRRQSDPHNVSGINNSVSDARAGQVEADEMLARELQEQLYNEIPGVGNEEIDTHIALALQQEETSRQPFSSESHPVFHPRGSLISNSRQLYSLSPQNPLVRRGSRVQGRTSTRLTRLRSQLPRQTSRMSYRERSSLFPSDMDLDMRIHILEALEAFNDMGVTGNFLQAEREFNENDYETLLALDESNHEHGGASISQINILPQSTVQCDNFEEACAICLETPTSGDTIRHLPCLHKFHKDCIDPWLRRRTSCPVCKSSIT
ncbi:hypothetical protein U1Q18_030802 [Sarracenia purpurea var. burkii]